MIDIKFTADGFSVLGDDHPDHLTKRAKALKKQPYDVVYRLGFFKPQSWFSPARLLKVLAVLRADNP